MARLLASLLLVLASLLPGPAAAQVGTSTSCWQIFKPTPGNPSNTNIWGTLLNTDFDLIDQGGAGILTLSVAGNSNVVLTSTAGAVDQARNAHYVFTGVLTGNINVLWPASLCRVFSVANTTSGAFTLSVGANNGSGSPAGTTVAVAQGQTLMLVSDGTNLAVRGGSVSSVNVTDQANGGLSFTGGPVTVSGAISGKLAPGDLTAKAVPTAADLMVIGDAAAANQAKATSFAQAFAAFKPTRTVLTAGSGTYTTPAGATRLFIRMVGGGAGGAGSATTTLGGAGNGGNSTFGALTALGGGAAGTAGNGGDGSGASGGDLNLTGQNGIAGIIMATGSQAAGGAGGSTPFGGAGAGLISSSTHTAAQANTGSGGAGGGFNATGGGGISGGGGGASGYLEKLIVTPAATYAYAVGAAGTGGLAGTSGFNGGAGSAGLIIIDEYYN